MRLQRPHLTAGGSRRAVYWLYAAHLWAILGIAVSNILLGLGLLVAPFAERPRGRSKVPRGILVPLSFYGLFVVVSCLNSHDPSASLAEGGKLLFAALSLLLGVAFVRGEGAVRRIVDGLLIVGGLAAVYGLAQYLGGFDDLQDRIRGPFSHYMTLAGVLLIVDSLLIAQIVCGVGRRTAWRWLLLAVVNAALLIGLTRGAWLALTVAVAVLFVLRSARWLWLYVPAVVLLTLIAPGTVRERIASIGDLTDPSTYDRICMAEAGFRMVAERPLFGVGPQMVRELYPIYRHPSAPSESVPHLHNTFLQIAAETGVPTLICFLWLLVGAVRLSYRGYRRAVAAGGKAADLYLGALVALLAFSLAGLFEDNWSDGEVKRMMLFLLAVPYCLGDAERSPDDSAESGAEAERETGAKSRLA